MESWIIYLRGIFKGPYSKVLITWWLKLNFLNRFAIKSVNLLNAKIVII